MKKIFLSLILLSFLTPLCFADQYVPEFNKMKVMRCEIVETVFENDKEKAVNGYHRTYRLDDEYQNIYLEKDFINGLAYYGDDKIIYNEQTMTDFSIVSTHVEIDRKEMKITVSSRIEYDNPDFGEKESVGIGECKYL
ncbi:hypothetical protein IJ674_00350 [bacterium]|nr:hypothetical protein [bacterium]